MKKYGLLFIVCMLVLSVQAIGGYKFRVQLKDKGRVGYTTDKPLDYLSQRAIDRRSKQQISVDETDFPISANYIQIIEGLGCKVIAKSKWNKTLNIYCADSSVVANIRMLAFVKQVDCVWLPSTSTKATDVEDMITQPRQNNSIDYYGYGLPQLDMLKGRFLHNRGYKGDDMQIAVIDAGFTELEQNTLLDNISILGTKDFVYEAGGENIHGFNVLTLMSANRPATYVGTAPNASYWLLRSEDVRSETPVEEDYWVAAIEYADSVGVDIVNSSLGYTVFDKPFSNYTWDDLDGKTSFISRAAEMATEKGIFVLNAAGNDGNKTFEKIGFPADVEHVLTVGSVDADSLVSDFSSTGLTADGRIKPDVVALGRSVNFISSDGTLHKWDGTSYAAPIVSGLVACLWQAFPALTNYQLLDIIRKAGHKYTSPDKRYGSGIPDMEKAFRLAENGTSGIEQDIVEQKRFDIQFLSDGVLYIKNTVDTHVYQVIILDLNGRIVHNEKRYQVEQYFNLSSQVGKVFIVYIRGNGYTHSVKVMR
ncbi:MAG: hypothetical protein RL662_1209 [Bacteroidota bacterium]|jgi:hypothetical protein